MSKEQRIQAQQQKQALLALIGEANVAIGALESFCAYTNNPRYLGEACYENTECSKVVNAKLQAIGAALVGLERVWQAPL